MVHRFLLTILPDAATAGRVTAWKRDLRERIGGFSGSRTLPHITLFFADLPAELEPAVIAAIDQGMAGMRAFTLHLNGMAHFPDRRVIYLDPLEKDAIARVRRPVVEAVLRDERLAPQVRETEHPHLTIAAGLKPRQFEAAWAWLAPQGLRSAQRVEEVVLLQRPLTAGSTYAPVRSFPLLP